MPPCVWLALRVGRHGRECIVQSIFNICPMVFQVIIFLFFMLSIPLSIKEHGQSTKPKYYLSPFVGLGLYLWMLWMGGFFTSIQLPQILLLSANGLGFIFSCWELATGYERKVNAISRIISGCIWQGILFWGGFYSF